MQQQHLPFSQRPGTWNGFSCAKNVLLTCLPCFSWVQMVLKLVMNGHEWWWTDVPFRTQTWQAGLYARSVEVSSWENRQTSHEVCSSKPPPCWFPEASRFPHGLFPSFPIIGAPWLAKMDSLQLGNTNMWKNPAILFDNFPKVKPPWVFHSACRLAKPSNCLGCNSCKRFPAAWRLSVGKNINGSPPALWKRRK